MSSLRGPGTPLRSHLVLFLLRFCRPGARPCCGGAPCDAGAQADSRGVVHTLCLERKGWRPHKLVATAGEQTGRAGSADRRGPRAGGGKYGVTRPQPGPEDGGALVAAAGGGGAGAGRAGPASPALAASRSWPGPAGTPSDLDMGACESLLSSHHSLATKRRLVLCSSLVLMSPGR